MSFPDQYARTHRFTAGVPRDFTVSPDGERIVYSRSSGGADPVRALWILHASTGAEPIVADPAVLVDTAVVPAEERMRRDRARDLGSGITTYATDQAVQVVTFGLSGRLWAAELDAGHIRELPAVGPVVDPRPNHAGQTVAYVSSGALRSSAWMAPMTGRWPNRNRQTLHMGWRSSSPPRRSAAIAGTGGHPRAIG